jgi:transposase
MDEQLRRQLEQRAGRRSFLRGSALAAAALVGAAAFPSFGSAQDQPPPPKKDDEKKDEKKRDGDQNADQARADDQPAEEQDAFKVTKKDERGRDYRICPQCGYNMYKQDRTWTCENCGYSYMD